MKSLCMVATLAVCSAWTIGVSAQNYESPYGGPRLASANGMYQPTIATPGRISAQTQSANPIAPEPDLQAAPNANWEHAPQHAASNGGCNGSANGSSECSSAYGGCLSQGMWGGCCPNFYVNAKGLVMTRDKPNTFVTTYETGNNVNQLQGTADASAGWGGGFEIALGWNMDCQNALEISYFGLWGMKGSADMYDDNNTLSTPINNGQVDLPDNTNPAANFFDSAREHRITRSDEAHNIELNWIYHACGNQSCCRAVNVDILAGVRYFRFSEKLEFASLAGTTAVGNHLGDDPSKEAYLNVDTENNMVGFQLGSKVDWKVCDCFSLYATPKFGVYGNHATSHSRLTRGDGEQGIFTDTGNTFDVRGNKNCISFLASADVGMNYDITCNWSIYGGYRVMAATNVALSDNQIYPYLAGESDFQSLKSNGSLILHGAFMGTEFRW